VYTWAGVPLTQTVRSWAAIVACQERDATRTSTRVARREAGTRVAAISHRSAAVLTGTRAFAAPALTEVSLEGDGRPRLTGVLLHRMNDLTDEWVTTIDGPPVTTPARVVLDLATIVTPRLVRNVLEEWLADRKIAIDDVVAAIEAHTSTRRAGLAVVARILDDRALGTAIADSTLEADLATILRRYGVPAPEHHQLVGADGLIEYELDYAYPDARLAIEVNGYGVHVRSRGRWQDDLTRHNRLVALGWTVLYYSRDAIERRPRQVAAEIDARRVALLAARSD
jgi:hypothetical protein